MKSLLDIVNEDRIDNKTIWPGDKIIIANRVFPDKADWELTYIEKDKDFIYGSNEHGVVIKFKPSEIKEIKNIVGAPKRKKREMSFEQMRKIKYQIADLETQLAELTSEMENDPDILDERGEGGKATDKYGKEMNKLTKKLEQLYDKLG